MFASLHPGKALRTCKVTDKLPDRDNHLATDFMNQSVGFGALVLSTLIITGCGFFSPSKSPGDIPVRFSDLQPTDNCGQQIKLDNKYWDVDYLALYLSEPRVKIDGRWQALSFIPNDYQSRTVSLLEFTDSCETQKHPVTIQLDANEKLMQRATSIRFTLGLPFSENHLLESSAAAPVNHTAMFQSMRVGHSFMRIELKQSREPSSLWSFMLASGQCDAPSDDDTPASCAKPNRVTVDLPLKANVEDLRLSASLREIVFRAMQGENTSCNLGDDSSQECTKVLRNLTSRQWIRWDAPHQEYLKQN